MTTFENTPIQMKAIIMTLTVTLLFSINSLCQKNIIKFQVGYGFPLANSFVGESLQSNSSTTTYTGVYGSYGSGLRLEGGYIRNLNSRFSLEIDFSYLIGKSIDSNQSGTNFNQSISSSSRFYEISPLFRVNVGGERIKPYAAVGPVLGIGTVSSHYVFNGGEAERKYTGSVAIGAKAAVGAELTQGKFIFYAQMTIIAMSYSPDKSELTKYTFNGTDQLDMLTISQKQTVYKTSMTTINNSGFQDPNKPSEDLKNFLPLSSISLNAGVMYKF